VSGPSSATVVNNNEMTLGAWTTHSHKFCSGAFANTAGANLDVVGHLSADADITNAGSINFLGSEDTPH
jgi:hypothetical protein